MNFGAFILNRFAKWVISPVFSLIVLITIFGFIIFFPSQFYEIWYQASGWGINLGIFLFLYLLSIPVYYISLGRLLASAILRDRKKTIFNIMVNRIAWMIPYLYVVIYGRNYPMWINMLLFLWIIIMSIFFLIRIKEKAQ